MFGIHACVNRDLGDCASAGVEPEFLEFGTGNGAAVHANAQLLGDDRGGAWVIARDHQGTNAGAPGAGDRLLRLGTRWIDHANQPREHEIVFEPFIGPRRVLGEHLVRQPPRGDAKGA